MRIALAILIVLVLFEPAHTAASFSVPVPGHGVRVVELYWSRLDYGGVFVLQGESGDDAPCVQHLAHLRCVVEAGPLSVVAMLYTPHAPRCLDVARVRVRIDGNEAGTLYDAGRPASCVALPLLRG